MKTTTPGKHRRNERRHGLSEHVAQRQQVEKSDGRERAGVAEVFLHLIFDRNNVGQNVPMRDDDALGLGGGAGGEDDFGGLILGDRHRPRRTPRALRPSYMPSFVTGQNRARPTMALMRSTNSGDER